MFTHKFCRRIALREFSFLLPGREVLHYGTAPTEDTDVCGGHGRASTTHALATRVENGDDGSPAATRVAVCTPLSRCHARVRLVACRQRAEEVPEGRWTVGCRFRHVPLGAAVLTTEGGARLEASQGMYRLAQNAPRLAAVAPT